MLIAVIVLAACLFPLAPYKVKLVVVYLSMGVLMVLMGSLLLRGAIAGATWMAIGRSFWLLPNVLSEVRRQCCCCAHEHMPAALQTFRSFACCTIQAILFHAVVWAFSVHSMLPNCYMKLH